VVGPPDLVAGPVFKTGGGHGDMSLGGSIPLSYRPVFIEVFRNRPGGVAGRPALR